jgi:uncharacterized alkaline shock family protein YloU
VSTELQPRAAPEERGRTEIADRVLERIATHALREVDEAGGVARRLLGVRLGHDSTGAAPRVDAWVDGRLVVVRMRVSVVYPAPIREVTRCLRDHVRTLVTGLTGLEVRQVDIDVDRLVSPERPRRGVR